MTTRDRHNRSNSSINAAAGPTFQPVPERAGEILDRLSVCLHALRLSYDLGRREMRSTERAIRRLHRHGMASTANEFWETTALPRSQHLVAESRRVIDRELGLLAYHHPRTDPARAIAALPSTDGINDLGAWWQRRLRRAAQIRSIPIILTSSPASAEFLLANKEMMLLDCPPWSHSDRLLSAFELAHGQIVRYGLQRVGELLVDPPLPSPRSGPRAEHQLVEAAPG